MDICVVAQRPAEDRKAAAQKAADTRAERYGDEVRLMLSFAVDLDCLCWWIECHYFSVLGADPLRQEMRGVLLHEGR